MTENANPGELPGITVPDLVIADTSLKSLTEDGSRVGGYLVVWGALDRKDLTGEYFTSDTDFALEWFPRRPMLYHHGLDRKASTTLIGAIDKLEPDDVGLWAEAQIDLRNKYARAVKDLVLKGALSWSSGSMKHLVKKEKDGRITRWPLIEGTATPTPAEPRMTEIAEIGHLLAAKTAVLALKALQISPEVLELGLEDSGSQEGSALDGQEAVAPADAGNGKALKDVSPAFLSEVEREEREDGKEDTSMVLDENAVKALFEKFVTDRALESEAAKKAADDRAAEIQRLAAEKAKDIVAAMKSLPLGKVDGDESRLVVTRATRYSELGPSDMGFMHEILNGIKGGWDPGIEFYRELADKATKAVAKNELPLDALKSLTLAGLDALKTANDINTAAQAGSGLEWVPDSWRSELWLKVRQENVIAPLFNMVEMPTNPYELPFEGSDPTVYFVAETNDSANTDPSTSPTPVSKPGSGKKTMNAKKLALRVAWSAELNEDSLIPIITNYRRQAIRAMQNAIDNVLVNGDTEPAATGNVNLVDSTPPTGSKYLAFDGLRKYCLVTNTAQKTDGASVPNLSVLRRGRFLMAGAYATQPRECAWLVDYSTYGMLLNLGELITKDKAGELATALTGTVGIVDGVPVFVSAEMGLSNTAGKISNTGSNNTKGQAIIVYRPNWMVGYRRQVRAAVEFLPWADSYQLVVTARLCMISQDAVSAAEVFNLTAS